MEDGARLSVGGMFALIGAEVERGVEGLPFPAHVATNSRDVERRIRSLRYPPSDRRISFYFSKSCKN